MYGICFGACVQGIEGKTVRVEIDLSNGLPAFAIVGLPDVAVRESTERVRAALKNGSYEFPMRRITVNLAPADVRKEGASFDLAIAVGILLASGQWSASIAESTMFLGELSLLGEVRPVPGVLSMAAAAKGAGLRRLVVPWDNAREAALVDGLDVVPIRRLGDIVDASGARPATPVKAATPPAAPETGSEPDFADVVGLRQSKRALAIAAAGMHNVLFIGPPGSGKTMLMRRLGTILPPLDDDEALEVTKIYSAAGQFSDRGSLVRKRPFRSTHHTITAQGMVGGGSVPRPGEASLAHRGVLFLDELPEYPRAVLEALRQPLEDGFLTVARAKTTLTYPARFLLAGTMNPCPCGYDGYEDEYRHCICSLTRKIAYLSKLSGPLIDRIDIVMDIPRMLPEDAALWRHGGNAATASLSTGDAGGTGARGSERIGSAELRALVERARLAQRRRYREAGVRSNAELAGAALARHCELDAAGAALLMKAYRELGLSARAHDRVLRVARTIADIDGAERIEAGHVHEALLYRSLDLRKQRLRPGAKTAPHERG